MIRFLGIVYKAEDTRLTRHVGGLFITSLNMIFFNSVRSVMSIP